MNIGEFYVARPDQLPNQQLLQELHLGFGRIADF